jgi:hypothetical protein
LKREANMKKFLPILIFVAVMCMACVATVRPHGASVAIAPSLPVVVELSDPFYFYNGYYYYYHGDRWYYSQSKGGTWIDLPRNHYPKEVRFKGKSDERDWRHDRGRGGERDWGDERDRGVKRGHDRD